MAEKIKDGDFIEIDYVGRDKETGAVFDLTREDVAKAEKIEAQGVEYGPVTVVVGARHVIPGLDKKLPELAVGDKKNVPITPEDGFGVRNPSLVELMPRRVFKKERINPIPGLPVRLGNRRGVVKTVSGGRIQVDFNHPLAGKELDYEVEIHKKITAPDEQVKSLFKLHIPGVDLKDLGVKSSDGEVEITTPRSQKTRRYINLSEEIIAHDIIQYIKIKKVKFVDVFEENGDKSKEGGKNG